MQETWVQSLGQEDPLEKEMATHSNILAWEILWTEEPGGLQSLGSQRSWTWLATNNKILQKRQESLYASWWNYIASFIENSQIRILVKLLDFTVSLQKIQNTEERVKLHHEDASSKSRLRELCRQMTWFPKQVNFNRKTRINGKLAVSERLQRYDSLLQCIGEGNGTPLQYSCLENPMDGGAW